MPHTTPSAGSRPLLQIGSPGFTTWAAATPGGHTLLLGEDAAIHRLDCAAVAAAAGRVAVCSPDTLALEFAMFRFEGQVLACGACLPVLDVPASEFPA